MGRLFYQYFPVFALLLVLVVFIGWGGLWLLQKDMNIQRFETRLEAMNISTLGEVNTTGFPSRYDFEFEGFTLSLGEVAIQSGVTKVLNYSSQSQLAIVGFGSPITLLSNGKAYEVEAQELRASLIFYPETRLEEFILEGTNGAFLDNENEYLFEHFVLAWDAEHSEFALRVQTSSMINESFSRASSLPELLKQIEDAYLQ